MRHVWVFIENICTATCHSISVIFLLFGRRSPTILSLPPHNGATKRKRARRLCNVSTRRKGARALLLLVAHAILCICVHWFGYCDDRIISYSFSDTSPVEIRTLHVTTIFFIPHRFVFCVSFAWMTDQQLLAARPREHRPIL